VAADTDAHLQPDGPVTAATETAAADPVTLTATPAAVCSGKPVTIKATVGGAFKPGTPPMTAVGTVWDIKIYNEEGGLEGLPALHRGHQHRRGRLERPLPLRRLRLRHSRLSAGRAQTDERGRRERLGHRSLTADHRLPEEARVADAKVHVKRLTRERLGRHVSLRM